MEHSEVSKSHRYPGFLHLEDLPQRNKVHDLNSVSCNFDVKGAWDVTIHVSERGFDFRAQKSKPPDDLVLTEHAQ